MGISVGRHSYSTELDVDLTGAPGTPSNNWTAIAEVVNIKGPDIKITASDVTNLNSPNAAREFIAGLVDAGRLTMGVTYTQAQLTTFNTLIRTKKNYRIVFPLLGSESNHGNITLQGVFDELGHEFPEDGKIANEVGIKVSGLPTYNAPS